MEDDYYDNGLESAELENSGHPTKVHEPYHHGFVKPEEQFGPSQHQVPEINCARDYIDATNLEIQTFTCKKTNESLKPSLLCLSLNINNNKCVEDSQHENEVEEINLLRKNTENEDKNMDTGPEDKLFSKNNGGIGKLTRLSPFGIRRQLIPGSKQATDEARAQVESKHKCRNLQEHVDYTKIETSETRCRSKYKMASDQQLKVEYSKMMYHLNQDNDPDCRNTDLCEKNNPASGNNPKPCKTEIFRGRNSPKYGNVSEETTIGNFKIAGNKATTLQPKKVQAVATSHRKLSSTCVSAAFLWTIFVLAILSSVTLSQEDTSPLRETRIVLAGSNVRLDCSSNSENPIDWDYKPSDTRTTQHVYHGNLGLMSDDVSKRFSVDVNNTLRRYDLLITNVRTEDAGRYQCTEIFNEERQKLLELVVLKKVPMCNSQSLNNGAMGEAVFGLRQRPVVLNCSVAISDNNDLTLSIVSTNSTSYPNTTVLTRSESTVTIVTTIFPLTATSLNNDVFKCKVSVLEPPADASANDDSISCFYQPVIIHCEWLCNMTFSDYEIFYFSITQKYLSETEYYVSQNSVI